MNMKKIWLIRIWRIEKPHIKMATSNKVLRDIVHSELFLSPMRLSHLEKVFSIELERDLDRIIEMKSDIPLKVKMSKELHFYRKIEVVFVPDIETQEEIDLVKELKQHFFTI